MTAPHPLAVPRDRVAAPPGPTMVDIWPVRLDRADGWETAFVPLLSDEERARAAAFRADLHRRRHIVSHGVLRIVLAGYVGLTPEALCFAQTAEGKPLLETKGGPTIGFNLSHSGELALIAVTDGRAVGVDVEEVSEMRDITGLANRYFAPSEAAAIDAQPPDRRRSAFFRCWTRKEAFVKAIGKGLSFPLDRFEVTVHPEEPARLLSIEGEAAKAAAWSIAHLDPEPGYVGAVVVAGELSGYRMRTWDEAQ